MSNNLLKAQTKLVFVLEDGREFTIEMPKSLVDLQISDDTVPYAPNDELPPVGCCPPTFPSYLAYKPMHEVVMKFKISPQDSETFAARWLELHKFVQVCNEQGIEVGPSVLRHLMANKTPYDYAYAADMEKEENDADSE